MKKVYTKLVRDKMVDIWDDDKKIGGVYDDISCAI